jgi:hypothetical protein
MSCTKASPAEATFFRSYKQMMLSLDFAPESTPASIQIRLTEPNSREATVIDVAAEAAVSFERPERAAVVVARRPLDPAMQSGRVSRLRLVATGNRISIYWDGRHLLACDQPASQSGRPWTLTLRPRESGFRISKLRIEGE